MNLVPCLGSMCPYCSSRVPMQRVLEPCGGYNQEIPDISIKDYSSPEEWFDLLLESSKKNRAGRRTDRRDLNFINASGFLADDMIG